MDALFNTADNYLSVVRTNPYVSSSVTLFLVLYAGLAAPALPPSIAGLFEHSAFKLLILFMVLFLLKNQEPMMALMVAVGFVISLNTLSKYRIFTMANELNGLVGNKTENNSTRSPTGSYGPNGVAPVEPISESVWKNNGTNHSIKLRGHDYSHDDEPHGGNGTNTQQVAAPLHPDNKYQGPQGLQGPSGYDGTDLATIGTPDSQL